MTISNSEHILVLEENKTGNDFIIGDVHGNDKCFDSVLAAIAYDARTKILPNPDRLFIVGDLTDRGNDSIRVIRRIKKNNANPANPQIYVTCGNHEAMSLQTINNIDLMLANENMAGLLQIAARLKATRKSMDKNAYTAQKDVLREQLKKTVLEDIEVANHCKKNNGGEWLVNLYIAELMKKRITYTNGRIVYTDKSKIKMIQDFFSSMPYITHVKAKNSVGGPFNIVHADMPISDEELQRRISNGSGLNEQEVTHAIWAREKKVDGNVTQAIPDVGRGPDSIITYCGHSIVKDASQVIRRATNTVDIDMGTYSTDVALLVNHTKQTAMLVTTETSRNNVPAELNKLPDIVMHHLLANVLFYQRRKLFAATDNARISSQGKLQFSEDNPVFIQEKNHHGFDKFNLMLFKIPVHDERRRFRLELLGISTGRLFK